MGSQAEPGTQNKVIYMQEITYNLEPKLSVAEFIQVLHASGLSERRPVSDLVRIESMLCSADIILVARCSANIVGVSRAITDFAYCTYLSDLAVDRQFQRRGIGKALITATHRAAGLNTTLILLSAPAAAAYYPHIGLQPHSSCWTIPGEIG